MCLRQAGRQARAQAAAAPKGPCPVQAMQLPIDPARRNACLRRAPAPIRMPARPEGRAKAAGNPFEISPYRFLGICAAASKPAMSRNWNARDDPRFSGAARPGP